MAVMWFVKKLANNKPVGYCLDADDSGQRPINPHHSNSQREWELQSLHQRIHSPCTPTLHMCLKSLSLSLSPKIWVCKAYILHTPSTEPPYLYILKLPMPWSVLSQAQFKHHIFLASSYNRASRDSKSDENSMLCGVDSASKVSPATQLCLPAA